MRDIERVTYRVLDRDDPMFKGRGVRLYSGSSFDSLTLTQAIGVPDDVILCNGCNKNLYDSEELLGLYVNGHLHDTYCRQCLTRWWPDAVAE